MDSFVYAVVLKDPFLRFFGPERRSELADLRGLESAPVLFELSAHDTAIRSGAWPIVGRIDVDGEYAPAQFVQNEHGCEIFEAGGNMRVASVEECMGLERAVIWTPAHIEERLVDWAAGRPNPRTVEMRLRLPGDPPRYGR